MGQSLVADSVPAAVLSSFGLLPADGWRLRHLRTMNNAVFGAARGDNGPQLALRCHRPNGRDRDAITAELDLLDFLAQRLPEQIKVPRPRGAVGGDRLITVNETHYSLLEWIPGVPRRPDSGLDAAGARLLGQALGAIHAAADHWDQDRAPVKWDAKTLFSAHPGLMGADPAILQTILPRPDLDLFREVAEGTAEVFDLGQDEGLIHADFILGNCHWTTVAGRPSLGVLDFDDFGRGPRLFDLGAILGNFADYPETWDSHAAAFLAGYQSTRPLPEGANRDLPLMMAARHTSHCLWALGHRDQGQDWVTGHVQARMELARECLSVTFRKTPQLRTASSDDVEFLARVVLLANQDRYRERPDWDADAFHRGLIDDAADQVAGGPENSTTYVIVDDATDVGRLRLVSTSQQLEIAGLQVLPDHQNRGVGTAVIRGILDQSRVSGIPLVLEVETDNPDAQRLYERLGFAPASEVNGDRRPMTYQPAQRS